MELILLETTIFIKKKAWHNSKKNKKNINAKTENIFKIVFKFQ